MRARDLRGGLNYEGGRQRALFASASVTPYESIEQQRFFAWLEATARLQTDPLLAEALRWTHSVPNGAHVKKGHALRLIAEGLTKGILDISCDAPAGNWHGLRIELKRKGNKPTPEQLRYMAYLDRIGVRRALCYSWQEAARVLIDYLNLTVYAPIMER